MSVWIVWQWRCMFTSAGVKGQQEHVRAESAPALVPAESGRNCSQVNQSTAHQSRSCSSHPALFLRSHTHPLHFLPLLLSRPLHPPLTSFPKGGDSSSFGPFVLRSEGGTLGSCSDLNSDLNLKKRRLLPLFQPRLEVHVHRSDKAFSALRPLSKVHLTGEISEMRDHVCILCVFIHSLFTCHMSDISFSTRVFIPPAVLPLSLTAVHLWAWVPEMK